MCVCFCWVECVSVYIKSTTFRVIYYTGIHSECQRCKHVWRIDLFMFSYDDVLVIVNFWLLFLSLGFWLLFLSKYFNLNGYFWFDDKYINEHIHDTHRYSENFHCYLFLCSIVFVREYIYIVSTSVEWPRPINFITKLCLLIVQYFFINGLLSATNLLSVILLLLIGVHNRDLF